MAGLPMASVSLDLDNLWSYMKTHGDSGWEARPTFLDTLVPPMLDSLDALGLRITVFVVGLDATRDENQAALRSIAARGHEIGNHSFGHEPWLHTYTRDQLIEEIESADRAIEAATGRRPIGFRGPGYSWSPALLEILHDRGFIYDASTLPTFLGPLARAYYFLSANFNAEQRHERQALFGQWTDGFRPIRPYKWRLAGERTMLEIPVTTVPGIRTPFHLSYLLYLASVSERLMTAYLRGALAMCSASRIEPSFLLHPTDLLGGDEVPALAFFPGMDLPGRRKRELFQGVLSILQDWFAPVDMRTHARSLLLRDEIGWRHPPTHAPGTGALANR